MQLDCENHPEWKGDKASYSTKHQWIYNRYGKADKCEGFNCKEVTNNYEWANISGKYKRERSDWVKLCQSCHKFMDIGNKCRKGHELTIDNSYINPTTGDRTCRKCKKDNLRIYRIINKYKISKLQKEWILKNEKYVRLKRKIRYQNEKSKVQKVKGGV